MQITLKDLTKRFNRELIFENLNYSFMKGERVALIGSNGSGKSTLLQIISGFTLPSSGQVTYVNDQGTIDVEDIFQHISLASPYLEIIEEYTLLEQLNFHFKFKNIVPNTTIKDVISAALFEGSEHKFIKNFSSGMKQRLKLAMAFYSDTEILLLDEPASNLDKKGVEWYHTQLAKIKDRLVIIASNQEFEYLTCSKRINIEEFK